METMIIFKDEKMLHSNKLNFIKVGKNELLEKIA
jgi:hypothetical protein